MGSPDTEWFQAAGETRHEGGPPLVLVGFMDREMTIDWWFRFLDEAPPSLNPAMPLRGASIGGLMSLAHRASGRCFSGFCAFFPKVLDRPTWRLRDDRKGSSEYYQARRLPRVPHAVGRGRGVLSLVDQEGQYG